MPTSAPAEGKERRLVFVDLSVGLLELPSILSISTRFGPNYQIARSEGPAGLALILQSIVFFLSSN